MKATVGALFILILLVFAPARAPAFQQLDCPFPEGTAKWDYATEELVCKFSSTDALAPPVTRTASPVVVQQTPVVIQPIPLFQAPSYAGMFPFWLWGPVAYGPWPYYGWYGNYKDQDFLFGAMALATIAVLAAVL